MPAVGCRVQVPLGPRVLTGCVVSHATDLPEGATLKDVRAVLDEQPLLPPAVVDLCS